MFDVQYVYILYNLQLAPELWDSQALLTISDLFF